MASRGSPPRRRAELVTRSERLTEEFYRWERRGRGWQVWPVPVELEPPFRPFAILTVPPAAVVDDGRKPTLLGSLVQRIRGEPRALQIPAVVSDARLLEPEPERISRESALVEIQVSLPPTLKVVKETAEQFLQSLSYCARPVGFEIIGLPDSIIVQFVCREEDLSRLREQIRAHFPDAIPAEEPGLLRRSWDESRRGETVVVDFGLSHEFMRPLRTPKALDPDPLTAVTGALGDVRAGESGVFQVLFQPCRAPWTAQVMDAVTDASGGSFFADAPEILALARAKVSRPLFAAIVRVAAKSPTEERAWDIARALGGALAQFADPASNELIPLARESYDTAEHEGIFLRRLSRRSGMLMNLEELVSLVHLPSASVRSEKLRREARRTRPAPRAGAGPGLLVGENVHAGRTTPVRLSPEQRTRHTYVIGASGTGKSTLLLNMVIQDLEAGAGVGVLDPHGDLVDRILGYVPERRTEDVVLLDPSDEEYPVGFNILSGHSELEKTLLASDLVGVFRRLATSWGDQMTSVLGNAILAFLESAEGGTLADLRRFLVEKEFRRAFLKTVRDPEIVYYWEREFPLLTGKPQAPVLTRLDTFLRPKLIRYMVAQRRNTLDLGAVMNDGKIFLAKLSQGAIGEENAFLLGSLLVSKFQQVAMGRQELPEAERRPFYLYIDEFHNFITPSVATILAGARKYGLGLILAHQDLRQLAKDPDVLAAVLTNPCARIAFRVGDADARKLEEGFAAFRAPDLQSLGVGEAICRVERADWDFNLRTMTLPDVNPAIARARRERIIVRSRAQYGTPRAEVETLLREARAPIAEPESEAPDTPKRPQETPTPPATAPEPTARRSRRPAPTATRETAPTEPVGSPEVPGPAPLGRGGPQHQYLQELIKRWALANGYRATIEESALDGLGSVDVALEKNGRRIACEISVSSTPEQELGNVRKCLAAGFAEVALVSAEKKTLRKLEQHIGAALEEDERDRVRFATPAELFALLAARESASPAAEETVRGYRVETRVRPLDDEEREARRKAISKVILASVRRLDPGHTPEG